MAPLLPGDLGAVQKRKGLESHFIYAVLASKTLNLHPEIPVNHNSCDECDTVQAEQHDFINLQVAKASDREVRAYAD